jgi:hypothetical protein
MEIHMTRQLRFAVLSGLSLLSSLAMVHSVRAQSGPPELPAMNRRHDAHSIAAADQEKFILYWTTETGWRSELQLRNNLAAGDLTITPALRTPDGTETALSPVTVKPQEIKIVDLEAAVVGSAPQYIGTYGSLIMRYSSPSADNLFAMLMIHDVGHSVAFHIDATGQSSDPAHGSREGIWWLPNDTATDYLVLTNLGSTPLQLDLSVYDSSGREAKQEIALAARSTNRLSVRQLTRAAGLVGTFGGIKVFAPTNAGSLDSLHILFDEAASFSVLLKMFDYNPSARLEERDFAGTNVWTLRAPMLALSQPDPALAFPEGTVLQPQLLVRNVVAKPVGVNLRFNWRSNAASGKAAGPSFRLGPYETRRVDVAALQAAGVLPADAAWASVVITTSGLPDEVMAVAASYDQALRYGAQTPFSDQLAFQWVGSLWEYDAQHDSLITAGNGGTKPLQAAFNIYYNQGTQKYELEQTLQPDEQMWIDMGKLIGEHVPDKNGNVLPANLASGSYEVRDLTNIGVGNLFEGKVVYDKTYGHVTYGCGVCCAYSMSQLWFNPLGIPLLSSTPTGVDGYDTCDARWVDVSGPFWGHWSTTSGAIATVDYYANHTGHAVGSTTSLTYGTLERSGPRGCYSLQFQPNGGDNVLNATITVHFTGAKTTGDSLTFPSSQTCSQNLGLLNCSGPATWVWNVEIAAGVTDDASKWTTKQSYTGRQKGNWKDSQGILHAFDDPLNMPNDNPSSSFVQQPAGQTAIFWIDAPGHRYTYGVNEPIDSLTQVENFTSTVCSTVNTSACFSATWYLKLVVKPGAVLDTTNSQAAFGSASTNF